MKIRKNKKGFTLIELIVVIAIIGILGAIAIPRLTGFTATAKTKADAATIKNIQTAAYTAIAAGEITLPTALASPKTLTIGTYVAPPAVGATNSVINIQYFAGSVAPTKQGGGSFAISVDDAGDVTVN